MHADARSLTWKRSLPTVDAVLALVEDHFPLTPVHAVLIRSFTNDVYRIDTDDAAYALKIYGHGRFAADEVRWEQQFARHLVTSGLRVAAPVPLTDGDSVGSIEAPEGSRHFALTQWIPGAKPEPPWTDDLYRRVGANLAQFHEAADSFVSDYPRRPFRTGDEPAQIVAALADQPARRRLVERATAAADEAVSTLTGNGLRRGLLHGDPSLDNLHIDGDDINLYDLDLAGPGWQAEDLTGALSTDHDEAFLTGYTTVRPLSAVELDALPWLGLRARIDNLHFHLTTKPANLGTATLTEGWVDGGFAGLADAARVLGIRT